VTVHLVASRLPWCVRAEISRPYYNTIVFFFFSSRRRHTRCYRDWSSDVCSSDLSEIFSQVHAVVKAGHLIVAIEHQRRTLEKFTEAALFCLTPAWVIHGGIDVGIKTVLLRSRLVPAIDRLFLRETDLDDCLGAFEAIFPGHDNAQRGAILVGQHLTIHAEAEQAEGMHGFVHAKTFDVWPIENR